MRAKTLLFTAFTLAKGSCSRPVCRERLPGTARPNIVTKWSQSMRLLRHEISVKWQMIKCQQMSPHITPMHNTYYTQFVVNREDANMNNTMVHVKHLYSKRKAVDMCRQNWPYITPMHNTYYAQFVVNRENINNTMGRVYVGDTNADWDTNRYRLILAGDVELNPGPEITVYHSNARSLRKQLTHLCQCAPDLERCCDVIAITETWLTSKVADSELGKGFQSHKWFRRDRGSRGGGVAIAVRSSLQPRRLLLPYPDETETLLIHLDKVSITVAVAYRPPNDDASLHEIMRALASVTSPLIVVGDFNVPEIFWKETGDAASPNFTKCSNRAKKFINECNRRQLKQWVSKPTRGEHILDLVITRHLRCTHVDVNNSRLNTDHRETVAVISTSPTV